MKKIQTNVLLLATLGLCFIVALFFLVSQLKNSNSKDDSASSLVCSDNHELIFSLDKSLSEGNEAELEQMLKSEILDDPDYILDYNCVYPVLLSEIERSDYASAQQSLQLLKKLASEGQSISENYSYIIGMSKLEARTSHLQAQIGPEESSGLAIEGVDSE